LPAKNSVKYPTIVGDGVSANRLNIIDDGHVLIEPRYCWAACSRDMAAALALALAVIAVSGLCVFAGVWHLYIRLCSFCRCQVWHVWEVMDNPYMRSSSRCSGDVTSA